MIVKPSRKKRMPGPILHCAECHSSVFVHFQTTNIFKQMRSPQRKHLGDRDAARQYLELVIAV